MQRAALLRARLDRAGRRRRRAPARRAGGGPRPPPPALDAPLPAAPRWRRPRSGCWPSAARRPPRRGRTCSSRPSPTCARRTTTARARATTRSTSCWRTCTTRTRELRLGALETLYTRARAVDADPRALLRQPRRRPAGAWTACAATPSRWPRATCDNELDPAAVEAMMEAIESRYGIAQRWFRAQGGPARASTASRWPTSTRRSAAAARCRTRRRAASSTTAFTRLLDRGRRHGARVLRRAPRRRRAAARQARRRLLRLGGPGLRAVRAAEPHGHAARPDDDRARARPRHALRLLQPAADGALRPRAARAVRGAVDVRRADRLRPHAGDGAGSRRPARRSSAASWSRASRPSSARR